MVLAGLLLAVGAVGACETCGNGLYARFGLAPGLVLILLQQTIYLVNVCGGSDCTSVCTSSTATIRPPIVLMVWQL